MPETLEDGCTPIGTKKWHWYNVEKDLIEQGGLRKEDLLIDPFSMTSHGGGGIYKDNSFYFTWVKDHFLIVSAEEDNGAYKELIEAFAKVVGYKPFAKYIESSNGLVTTEWDKDNPKGRYKELQEEGKINLEIIEE